MASLDTEALLCLNQEILALVRARLPVASELHSAATTFASPASKLANQLQARMQAGASLDEAVEAESGALPTFYASLIRAGIRANRLPAALEAFHSAYQRLVELRRLLKLALAYPLFIALLAAALLVTSAFWLAPTYDWVEIPSPLGLNFLRDSPLWLAGIAIMLALLTVLFLTNLSAPASSKKPTAMLSRSLCFLAWFPGIRKIVRLTAYATFTELLSLLVRQSTPLDQALPWAAAATGWSPLEDPARKLAAHIAQGNAIASAPELLRQLPPLAQVSLLASSAPANLADQLAVAADEYDLRARDAVQRMSVYFPAMATAVVGGGVVSLYGILMLRPYILALIEITTWH